MSRSPQTLTVDLKRVIPGPPAKVFDAWLDPKQPCNPWNICKNVVLEPKVGKLFFFLGPHSNGAHFGRFLKLAKGEQVQYTWMSFYTRGLESTVTVRFKAHPAGTLMTLRHSGLPKDDFGRSHADGWSQFLGMLEDLFKQKKEKKS